ncbi:JmjC domain-containing protein, partial [Pseudomonas aeruginosa]|uniref:JmjC domain-containing protein n=1 Tax=Pseudomonas aeruginosa TaxID=287 RepID=UPI0030016257
RVLPDLRVERDTLVPKSAYTNPSPAAGVPERVDVAKLWELYTAGNTVFIGHLQKVWAPALTIAGPLCSTLACQANVLAVATAPHQAGVPAHHDELDVVVIQAQGTKNWRVWPTRSEGRDKFRVIEADREGAPVIEVTLQPGDVLYLP